MTAPEAAARIPISIVTGFLGSGKTTLIAALLWQPSMQGTAVIVNEFGEVGIDDAIIAETLNERDLLLLRNGCLCCTVGDDLRRTLWTLAQRRERPTRILVETTGLADPVSLLHRLIGDPRLRPAIRLDAVVATVDAVNGLRNLADQPVAPRQSAVADRRLVTKADLAGTDEIAALSKRLRALNPGAAIWPVTHGEIAADKLFGASLFNDSTGEAEVDRWLNLDEYRAQRADEGAHHHDHPDSPAGGGAHVGSIRSWLVEESQAVDWDRLSPRLGDIISRYGRSMLRLKGVIRTAGDPRPLVIHGVQQLFHSPVRLKAWPRPPATSIVVIGEGTAATAVGLIGEAIVEAVATGASPASVPDLHQAARA